MAEYEFSATENVDIEGCGRRAVLWGACSGTGGLATFLLGLVLVLLEPAGAAAALLASVGAYVVAAGVCFIRGGLALRDVALTEGSDVTLLLAALRQLSSAFLILSVLILAVAVAATLLLVFHVIPLRPPTS